MVPRFFFFFCANGVRISTDIYSFGFIWAFRIDRWRHPPLALLPSRPLPSCSLSSAHAAYLWYVSVQCANCILDTHPSGSANVCVYIYCIFVCTVCNIIRFKALKARCCIMNALFGVCVCTLCFLFACVFVFVYIYMYMCHNTQLASQQTTAHWSIWASLQCILQRDNPPLPRPLPPSASQLSPSSPTFIPLNLCDNASSAGVAASRGGGGSLPSSHVPLY